MSADKAVGPIFCLSEEEYAELKDRAAYLGWQLLGGPNGEPTLDGRSPYDYAADAILKVERGSRAITSQREITKAVFRTISSDINHARRRRVQEASDDTFERIADRIEEHEEPSSSRVIRSAMAIFRDDPQALAVIDCWITKDMITANEIATELSIEIGVAYTINRRIKRKMVKRGLIPAANGAAI